MDKMLVSAEKKNVKTLPKVKNVKVKVNRNILSGEDGMNRKANGFIVLVEIEGKGWFNENAVLHHYGFKTVSGTFKTYEKALAEANDIKARWGVSKAAEKAEKAKKDTEDALLKKLAAMPTDELAKLIASVKAA